MRKTFLLLATVICATWTVTTIQHQPWFFCDYRIYREAGAGNLSYVWHDEDYRATYGYYPGYTYPAWTAPAFAWMHWFSYDVGLKIWFMMITWSYVRIALKLSEYRYGTFLALVAIKLLQWDLHSGNAIVVFSALALTAPGALLAGCFKPEFLGVALLHPFLKATRKFGPIPYPAHRTVFSAYHLPDALFQMETPFQRVSRWLYNLGGVARRFLASDDRRNV